MHIKAPEIADINDAVVDLEPPSLLPMATLINESGLYSFSKMKSDSAVGFHFPNMKSEMLPK